MTMHFAVLPLRSATTVACARQILLVAMLYPLCIVIVDRSKKPGIIVEMDQKDRDKRWRSKRREERRERARKFRSRVIAG